MSWLFCFQGEELIAYDLKIAEPGLINPLNQITSQELGIGTGELLINNHVG